MESKAYLFKEVHFTLLVTECVSRKRERFGTMIPMTYWPSPSPYRHHYPITVKSVISRAYQWSFFPLKWSTAIYMITFLLHIINISWLLISAFCCKPQTHSLYYTERKFGISTQMKLVTLMEFHKAFGFSPYGAFTLACHFATPLYECPACWFTVAVLSGTAEWHCCFGFIT